MHCVSSHSHVIVSHPHHITSHRNITPPRGCIAPFSELQNSIFLTHASDLVPRVSENMMYSAAYDISYFHRTRSPQLPCFTRWKDIAIPPFVHAATLRKHFKTQDSQRTILASFSGSIRSRILAYSGGVRQTWLRQFVDSKRVLVSNVNPLPADSTAATKADYKKNFVTQMLNSVFCLCPPGWATWSPRIFEALMLGCIPVIIGSPTQFKSMFMPFEDAGVDWTSFALFVSHHDATHGIDSVLSAVPARKVKRMQAAVSQAWSHFEYLEPLYENHLRGRGGAIHWIVTVLSRRLPSASTSS